MQKYRMDSEADENAGKRVDQIKERITRLVDSRFNTGEKIVYLSQLGNELGEDRLVIEKLTGTRLRQYLHDHFPYAIGATGQHGNVYFLAPPGTDLTLPVAVQPEPRRPTIQGPAASAIPRYASRFWAAFAKPLQPGESQRFINLSTLFFGPDADTVRSENGGDIRLIEQEYIAPQGASGSAAETSERVAKWLQAQRLDGRDYLAVSKRSTDRHGSLLAAMIDTLTQDQLRRTTLPLDVVKALSEHRG